MSVTPSIRLHDFVAPEGGFGLGQVTALDYQMAEVSYFDSPTNPSAELVTMPVDSLHPVELEPKRRVFVRAGGCWWTGRVEDHEGDRYLIRFPGGERWLEPRDLRVRWSRPPGSPIDDLIALSWWGHPAEVALRVGYLEDCSRQRRGVRGLAAMHSLVAEPHGHQLEVARRVLEDPVGRFLLADEVGLGKTIEALYVVRQFLLDDPGSRIRVIAPRSLCAQWRDELEKRVFVSAAASDFPYAAVEVMEMGDPASWSNDSDIDLLVIDEAHRVAAWSHSRADGASRSYAAAEQLTDDARAVLLISATPSLHSSTTFLALLHLLDPHRHDLDDLAGFEALLARREAIASALLGIDSSDPAAILIDSLTDLREAIPPDTDAATEIEALVQEMSADAAVDHASRERIERVKLHVAENFRVDRRMLRTRRRSVERRFPVRGRESGEPFRIHSPDFEEVDGWFERWRSALLLDAYRNNDAPPGLGELVGLFADRVIGAPGLVAPLCRARLGEASPADVELLSLSTVERATLREVELQVGSEEESELRRAPMLTAAFPRDAAELITERLWDQSSRKRTVVLTSFTAVAREVQGILEEVFHDGHVAAHLVGASNEANREALSRFAKQDDPCHILVCDRSAEEGLNLQFADALLLLDVPLAVDRLEQRIGRLDRFSRAAPVRIELIRTLGHTELRDAWDQVLTESFRIFDRSIAALQIAVAELLTPLRQRLAEDGPRGLQDASQWVADQLAEAERELTRSELLDGIWADDEGERLATAVAEVDEGWPEWRSLTDRLFAKSLRLIRWFHSDEIVSFWLQNPRVRQIEPDIDAEQRIRYFVDVVSHGAWTRRSTYERVVALEHPGVRLLRVGDPLIDSVENYLRHGRYGGRTAVIWRKTPRPPDGVTQLGFVFDYSNAVEVDAGDLSVRERSIAAHRVFAVVPPMLARIYVSVDGGVLDEDDDLSVLLSFEFDPRRGDSVVFGPGADAVVKLASGDWEAVVQRAETAARSAARERFGIESSQRLVARARSLAEARTAIIGGRGSWSDPSRESVLGEAVERAVESADARLETVQVVVVSQDDPPAFPRLPPLRETV